ncbi:MAG: hypothetical protein ACLQMF_07055 [Rectinemataceae bacterium]
MQYESDRTLGCGVPALLDETERDERYSSKSALRDHERYSG